jgi:hypothetical protein
MTGFRVHAPLMKKLGSFRTGSSCLYVKRLDDIDVTVLEKIIRTSVALMKTKYAG